MPSRKAQWVGLDIGTQSIKIINFEKKRNRWLLKKYQFHRTTESREQYLVTRSGSRRP